MYLLRERRTSIAWRATLFVEPASAPKNKFLFADVCVYSLRAGPKSLRAESARAVTGRRCPHRGKGEDFLTNQLNFFTETAVTQEQKVEKSFPRSEFNRHAEG